MIRSAKTFRERPCTITPELHRLDRPTLLGPIRPMPGPAETLVDLEQRLAERLLDFDLLDEAWPKERGL